jgi:hypothetical protein
MLEVSSGYDTISAASRQAIGPQRVGGVYHNAYWGKDYRVLSLHLGDAARKVLYSAFDWAVTVADIDGPNAGIPRTHCTAWHRRDRVVKQPGRPE